LGLVHKWCLSNFFWGAFLLATKYFLFYSVSPTPRHPSTPLKCKTSLMNDPQNLYYVNLQHGMHTKNWSMDRLKYILVTIHSACQIILFCKTENFSVYFVLKNSCWIKGKLYFSLWHAWTYSSSLPILSLNFYETDLCENKETYWKRTFTVWINE